MTHCQPCAWCDGGRAVEARREAAAMRSRAQAKLDDAELSRRMWQFYLDSMIRPQLVLLSSEAPSPSLIERARTFLR